MHHQLSPLLDKTYFMKCGFNKIPTQSIISFTQIHLKCSEMKSSLFFFLIVWSNSWVKMILSVIDLPLTNAFWWWVIRSSMISFSLFAKTLAAILYATLHKLIGLYSQTSSELRFLGTKVINVLLSSLRM